MLLWRLEKSGDRPPNAGLAKLNSLPCCLSVVEFQLAERGAEEVPCALNRWLAGEEEEAAELGQRDEGEVAGAVALRLGLFPAAD